PPPAALAASRAASTSASTRASLEPSPAVVRSAVRRISLSICSPEALVRLTTPNAPPAMSTIAAAKRAIKAILCDLEWLFMRAFASLRRFDAGHGQAEIRVGGVRRED